MRVWWAVAVVVAGMSVSGLAQQSKNQFKVKPSRPEKQSKAAPPLKTANTSTASSKELAAVEREKIAAPRSAKKTPALKPVQQKERSNPPINIAGGATKNTGRGAALPDPNKGRVRQKGGGKGQ